MRASIIFHSRLEPQVSPVISLTWWGPADDLHRQVWTVAGWGNDPDDVCAKFIAWSLSQPRAMAFVHSLPGLPWGGFETDAEVRAWYERVVAESATWDPPALLADVDGGPVTQDGAVRWSTEAETAFVTNRPEATGSP